MENFLVKKSIGVVALVVVIIVGKYFIEKRIKKLIVGKRN